MTRQMNGETAGRAFREVPVRPVGNCTGPCVEVASSELSLEAKRALNLSTVLAQGRDAIVIGDVVSSLPRMNFTLQSQGVAPKTAEEITNAILAAAVQSKTWRDPIAQSKVVKLANDIEEKGLVPNNTKQVNQVVENCKL